jgi:hypothetical protein
MRRLGIVAVGLALVLGGARHEAVATDWCSGGVCQEWVARYDGPTSDYDDASALAVDLAGNVYVTGSSEGDIATVKYSPDGSELWVRRFDGGVAGGDSGMDIAVDSEGNVYVAGQADLDAQPGEDATVVKYDTNGMQQWVAHYRGPTTSNDFFSAIALDTVGNVYVTGTTHPGDYPSEASDYVTIKYDPAGVEQWVALYSGSTLGTEQGLDVAVDGVGNVYVTGLSYLSPFLPRTTPR